jgi:stalled ribosome rescue protein Dom34
MTVPQLSFSTIRGISYPLRIENGNLAVSTDYSLKAQQIRSVIETRFFERVMRADYGVGDHTLEVMNPGQINSEFQASIAKEVEDLTSLAVSGDWITGGDDGIYRVFIVYSVDGIPQPPVNFSLSN